MSQTVFILGAGASVHAGAPLMANFLNEADKLRRQRGADDFKKDFDFVFDAISALQPVHSKSALDLDNIESVFAAFEMGRLINKFPGMTSDDIKLLLVSIRRLIYKTLEKTITFPVKHRAGGNYLHPTELYDMFVKMIMELNNGRQENKCSIITFNYDLALDYALHYHSIPANYCLSETTGRGNASLMKLHGSLNWASCLKCGEIIPWHFGDFYKKFRHNLFDQKSVCIDLPSNLSKSGLKHCERDVGSEPFIIPPTWNKTEYHQGLSKVWGQAALELSDAENIFIIGYSLSKSDLFFRYLFALGSLGKTRIKNFFVFDPDRQNIVNTRFEELIGPGLKPKFEFIKEEFGSAIQIIRKTLELD
ncbi:MAG TPA: hypothetical protein VMW09_00180 [Desulfatiglandales bacterium]|nr:hypothetical protein [Desulfatiglandales bacterium]